MGLRKSEETLLDSPFIGDKQDVDSQEARLQA
jgi:hypothetical protein